jgi:hypothetical protein
LNKNTNSEQKIKTEKRKRKKKNRRKSEKRRKTEKEKKSLTHMGWPKCARVRRGCAARGKTRR